MIERRAFLSGAGAFGFCATAARAARPMTPARALSAADAFFADLQNGDFGADKDGRDFRGVLMPLLPQAVRGTSMEVLNALGPDAGAVILKNLPTVAQQGVPGNIGAPGSCEAESFGYALGAYTAARKPSGDVKWSAGEAQNQPSCAWLYHWQHVDMSAKDCPAGSQSVPYVAKLVATGAPSTALFPYNPNDAVKVPGVCGEIDGIDVNNLGPSPERLMLGSYKGFANIQNQQGQFLDTFKALIRHGHAVAFTGLVPKQYCVAQPPLDHGAFNAPSGFVANSGHGQLLVGYDDHKGPGGAFLVQNSFGPTWNPGPADDAGFNGRIWYAYEAFFAGQQFALVAYPNNDNPPQGVRLAASGSGAPALFVKETPRHQQNGKYYLVLVLHGTGPVNIAQFQVTGPRGHTTSQTLNETLRFGYVYVERNNPFAPGAYQVRISGTTTKNAPVTYTGGFQVA